MWRSVAATEQLKTLELARAVLDLVRFVVGPRLVQGQVRWNYDIILCTRISKVNSFENDLF